MTRTGMSSIFQRLAEKQVVLPYLENAFHSDEWPESYTITVDSSPYYGLADEEGVTHDTGAGDGYFHPSSHSSMGARELYYRFHPEHAKDVLSERRTLTSHLTLAAGTAMHAVIQNQLNMTGILKRGSEEWEQMRPGVRGRYVPNNLGEWEYINEDRKCRGRSDGILDIPDMGEMLFEFKTMNSRSFRFLDCPKDEWDNQTNLGMDHYGVDEGRIVVLEMGYPFALKEFKVLRRPSVLEPIYERWEYVRECIKRDTPPPCEHALATAAARSCPVGNLCWRTEEGLVR